MIVSWNWLLQYVPLEMSPEDLEARLTACGLNHEGSEAIGKDIAIDLEVTSNRPDCLGHIGVAREISAIYDVPLSLPDPQPPAGGSLDATEASLKLEVPEMCPRYTARVIRGVRVGPSPDWLVDRLKTVYASKQGARWEPINNVVDITNYVLLESGQPLHAFDLNQVAGRQIVVRRANEGEEFLAINHKTYTLNPSMCVIADRDRPIALGGVMGGADTEVSNETTDLLIESAMFAPLAIRSTARALTLFSDSSYRFERGPDPSGVDWASRRCCELILDVAGGELAEGTLEAGRCDPDREPIVLRLSQIERILGIEVPREEVERILSSLGNRVEGESQESLTVVAPSWRRDLSREIDLVEEVARVHGYDKIPEDRQIPICASSRSREDRVADRIYRALTAAGFDEVVTPSATDLAASSVFSPWTSLAPIQSKLPMLRGADCLRKSLVPSLLQVRKTNENLGVEWIELFEIASIYLPTPEPHAGQWHEERKVLSLCSGKDFFAVKGVIESLLDALGIAAPLNVTECSDNFFQSGRGAELTLNGSPLGYLGIPSPTAAQVFSLRGPVVVAEVSFAVLLAEAELVPLAKRLSPYPTIDRDFNFEVDERVRWAEFASTVRQVAGEHLESIRYLETYRDKDRLGEGMKSLVFKVVFRKADGTLTGDEADKISQRIESACGKDHSASLRS